MSIPFFIIISGPTGVGKTALVDELIETLNFPIEVINADMGQLYEPLTIGTAKPDVNVQKVPHHMFDIVKDPVDFTATQYRDRVRKIMLEISSRGAVPLLVGGSGFYLATLFFPPSDLSIDGKNDDERSKKTTDELWELLQSIDPDRAMMIHKHDRYRIERALHIWRETGTRPSLCEPEFNPPGRCAFYYILRDKEDLHARINERTKQMLEHGWFDEVKGLREEWHAFLVEKKLIGYPEIITYLKEESLGLLPDDSYERLVEKIAQKTRGYAKRQITFYKHLKKRLMQCDPSGEFLLKLEELNLSQLPGFPPAEATWLAAQYKAYKDSLSYL